MQRAQEQPLGDEQLAASTTPDGEQVGVNMDMFTDWAAHKARPYEDIVGTEASPTAHKILLCWSFAK